MTETTKSSGFLLRGVLFALLILIWCLSALFTLIRAEEGKADPAATGLCLVVVTAAFAVIASIDASTTRIVAALRESPEATATALRRAATKGKEAT